MSAEETYDVIIIGSGPAGLTATIYASRAALKTLLIGGNLRGGQLMFTTDIENFPGFEEGIPGPDLMNKMQRQAERFGAEVLFEDVIDVDFSANPFTIKAETRTFRGISVILATGSSPKWLGLESEARLRGRGVSVCATCDAALFKDKNTVVVGGGDTAMEEALALARVARKVTVIHRRSRLRATKILQDRVLKSKNISLQFDSVVQEISGMDRVEGIRLKNTKTGEETKLLTDAVFIAVGYKPNTEIFRDKIDLDEMGYAKVHEGTKSSVEGVFVAGDVGDRRYRQAVTAAGSGCKAALDAIKYLEAKES